MDLKELTSKIFDRYFRFIILILFLVELISLSGYLVPKINYLGFFIILLIALILTLKNLKYGVFIALAELFIGSKGYLFFFETGGIIVSIRIALWLIVLAVWLSKFIIRLAKKEKTFLNLAFLKKTNLYLFVVLFIFILWGIVNGFLNNNSFNNIFFDANGWLYFLLIFPILETVQKEENFLKNFLQIFFAATLWLVIKTFILLFIFSHNLIGAVYEVYRWIRVTGVGEITIMESGFIRIFFQSHLFVLVGFFFALFIFNKFIFNKKTKEAWIYFVILTLFSTIVILSFSRSFWVGMLGSFLVYAFLVIKKYGWKNFFFTLVALILSTVVAISLIAAVIKFPYPEPSADFNLSQLTQRASRLTDESAASSRYALLPPLMEKIKKNPILGQGFGATVTYQTSDPRILEQTADGTYTTYAFEWGWLDIWLKLGIIGCLFYLFIIGKIFKKGTDANNWLADSLSLGLVLIVIISFFSPYTNHPLGIGYLILTAAILTKK